MVSTPTKPFSAEDHDLSTWPTVDLIQRYDRLQSFPLNYWDAIHSDPRCGCGEDGEGSTCELDDLSVIEGELAVREA